MRLRSLTGIITRDFKNKAFALFFAVTVWYFAWNNQIRNSNRGKVRVTVQVETPRDSEKAYELVRVYTVRDSTEVPFNNYVSVILSGPQREIRELDWNQVTAQVTIRPEEWPETEGYRVGQIELTKEYFHLPSRSLRVVENSIQPGVIYFQLSPIVVKPLPVRPAITGSPPPPYRLSATRRWTVQPKELYVRGPEQYFAFFELVTEKIDVTDVTPEGLRYTVTVPVRLQLREEYRSGGGAVPDLVKDPRCMVLVDENGLLLKKEDARAKVTVFFEREDETRQVLTVKLWALIPLWQAAARPFAVKCEPSQLAVTFVGTKSSIEALNEAYRRDPTSVGLYFTLEPEEVDKLGAQGRPIHKTLDVLRWDTRVIPADVRIEPAPPSPGTGPGPRVIEVRVLPVSEGTR